MANKDLIPAKDEEFNSFQSNLVTLVTENAVFIFTEAIGINVFQSAIRIFYPKDKVARGYRVNTLYKLGIDSTVTVNYLLSV